MALTLAGDYIYQAYRKCGQLRPGARSNTDMIADGLNEWQMLVDSWAAERTMQFSIPQLEFVVNKPGSQNNGNGYLVGPAYTFTGTTVIGSPVIACAAADTLNVSIGEAIAGVGLPANSTVASFALGGTSITINQNCTAAGAVSITATPDFNTPRRPDSIVNANCVMLNTGPQPVYIPMVSISQAEWANQAIRQIPAINVTTLFYYDPQFPNGVFNVFPPLLNNGIELFTWGALGPPATANAPIALPPGYLDAVIWSLAERLWPLCTHDLATHKMPFGSVANFAHQAREKVRRVNRPLNTLASDFRGGAGKPTGYYDSFISQTGLPT